MYDIYTCMSQNTFSKPETNSSQDQRPPECVPGSVSPTSLMDRQQSSLWPVRCQLDLGPAFC